MSEVLGQNLGANDNGFDSGASGDDFSYEAFVQENVGEGKKYSTPEDALAELAKKAVHADTFIETLKLEKKGVETERETLTAQLAEAKKIDDLMGVLTADASSSSGNQAQGDNQQAQSPATKEEITGMVRDLLKAERDAETTSAQEAVQKENKEEAWQSLVTQFGGETQAKKAIQTYVGTDESRRDILNRMGAFQPGTVAAFLKLTVGENEGQMNGSGETAFNVKENTDINQGMLTWAKTQQVKKDDPKLYRSRQYQLKIHQAADTNPNFWN